MWEARKDGEDRTNNNAGADSKKRYEQQHMIYENFCGKQLQTEKITTRRQKTAV